MTGTSIMDRRQASSQILAVRSQDWTLTIPDHHDMPWQHQHYEFNSKVTMVQESLDVLQNSNSIDITPKCQQYK